MRLMLNTEIWMGAGPRLQVRDAKDLLALSLHRLSEDVQGGVRADDQHLEFLQPKNEQFC